MPLTDRQLLRQYLQGSHAPFEELVRRHIDVIYAAARRQVGPAHADDITQSVFIMLAQKAPTLQHRESLIGWLYRAATFCCFNLRRAEALRRQHERQAAMAAPAPTREPTNLTELLDAALAKLGDRDREVLLLHYLQQKSHGETAAALGISEEAARKRAARALEKFRAFFLREGASAPLASVTTLLAAQFATKSPPALLAATLTATAHTAAHVGPFSLGGSLLMSTAKTKLAAIALAALLLIALSTTFLLLRSNLATPAAAPAFVPAPSPVSTVPLDPVTAALPVAPDELAGRVLDSHANPVPDALVSLPRYLPFDKYPSTWRADRIPPTHTDANGIFRFPHLGDTWISYLQVEKAGFATQWLPDVARGRPNEIRLDDSTHFTGTLLRPDNSPDANTSLVFTTDVPSTRPEIAYKCSDVPFTAVADAQGRFDIPLAPGEFDLRITAPDGLVARLPLSIQRGQTLHQSILLTTGVHLLLHITDELTHLPVAGVDTYIWRRWGNADGIEPGTQRASNAQGLAEWTNAMPGFQHIAIQTRNYNGWKSVDNLAPQNYPAPAFDLEPDPTGPTQIEIQLVPTVVYLTGKVLNPDHSPAPRRRVTLVGLTLGAYHVDSLTNTKGQFVLRIPTPLATPNNQCRVIVPNPADDTTPLASSTPFTLTVGGTTTQPAFTPNQPITLLLNTPSP